MSTQLHPSTLLHTKEAREESTTRNCRFFILWCGGEDWFDRSLLCAILLLMQSASTNQLSLVLVSLVLVLNNVGSVRVRS